MGQPVVVIEKPSARPGIARFELNRVLTGMGHEHYSSNHRVVGERPPDVLARRIFALVPGVRGVHINASVVTLEVGDDTDHDAIRRVIEDLYTYYRPGVERPHFEEPATES